MSGKGRGRRLGRGRPIEKKPEEKPAEIKEELSTQPGQASSIAPLQQDDEFEPYDPAQFEEPEWITKEKKKEKKSSETDLNLSVTSRINPVVDTKPISQSTRSLSKDPSSQAFVEPNKMTYAKTITTSILTPERVASPTLPQNAQIAHELSQLKIEENISLISSPPGFAQSPIIKQQPQISKEADAPTHPEPAPKEEMPASPLPPSPSAQSAASPPVPGKKVLK
jgi:hypothetical protein